MFVKLLSVSDSNGNKKESDGINKTYIVQIIQNGKSFILHELKSGGKIITSSTVINILIHHFDLYVETRNSKYHFEIEIED